MDETIKDVQNLKNSLEKASSDDAEIPKAIDILQELASMKRSLTVDVLKRTQLGLLLNKLRKHPNQRMARMAIALFSEVRDAVTDAKAKTAGGSDPVKNSPAAKPISAQKMSSTPSANAKKLNLVLTGNDARDRARKDFAEVLCLYTGSDSLDPGKVAADIETHMFSSFKDKDYKNKYRSLLFNLRDPKNPQLREDVMTGVISAPRLIQMKPDEMACEELKREREELAKKKMEEILPDHVMPEEISDAFKCPKCSGRRCIYAQTQNKLSEEFDPTVIVDCLTCRHRWEES